MKVVAVSLGPRILGPRAIAHDSELAFRLAGPDGVVCACEVEDADDGPFEDAAHRAGKRVRFRNRRTQVAHPASWRSSKAIHYLITRPPLLWTNPGRDLNIVFDHDAKEFVAAIHAPNQRRGKPFWRLSVAKNGRYLRRVARKVSELIENGWSGHVAGDGNGLKPHVFHERQVVTAQAGLMWVVSIPAPGKYVDAEPEVVDRSNNGDHPIVVADATFKKGPKP